MSETPFIKFFPSDFLGGTSGLTPAERGVYITILCLIWDGDGPVAMDDARLARRCGMPKAPFNRILSALIDDGKIIRTDRGLTNKRAEKALVDRHIRRKNATHAARKKWGVHDEKNEQNQCKNDAGAMREQCESNAKPEARSQKPDNKANALLERGVDTPSKDKKQTAKATRLTADWKPDQEYIMAAITIGLSEDRINYEVDKFRDYWISKSGKDATKLNWLATWRNWCRRAVEANRVENQRRGFGQSAAIADAVRQAGLEGPSEF